MEFDNSFEVPLSPAQAWSVLMDIPRIAPCMPGAELTEVVDPQNFGGKISVRLGPVALAFAGRLQIDSIDDSNHSARVKAQGNDTKGRGAANATATFRIEPAAADPGRHRRGQARGRRRSSPVASSRGIRKRAGGAQPREAGPDGRG